MEVHDSNGTATQFKDEHLGAGSEGGVNAAAEFSRSIQNYLQELESGGNVEFAGASQWRVMVRVYANFAGLSRKLVRVGINGSVNDLAVFASSFTCSQPLFDFVDAGCGKEGADYKIRGTYIRLPKNSHQCLYSSNPTELFNLFIGSAQCKHIIFGGCHDMGYISLLAPYKSSISRITLLGTGAIAGSLPSLDFRKADFFSVFRSTSLPDDNRRKSIPTPRSADFSQATTVGDAHSTSPSPVSPGPGTRVILLNRRDQRIDSILPQPPVAAWRVYEHVSKRKLCNDFHLLGRCGVARCIYDHRTVAKDTILVIRHQVRKQACTKGSACRSFDCYYGHVCPRAECTGDKRCKFKKMHMLDLIPVREIVE